MHVKVQNKNRLDQETWMNHKNPAFVPRSPWGDFPDVVRIADLGSLKKEPEYWAAKAGNALTVSYDGALHLPIRPEMVDTIYRKHGIEATKEFAREQWGYGIECLTQGEAGHLRKALSLDGLRDRFSVARDAHGRRLGESRTCSSLSKTPNSRQS